MTEKSWLVMGHLYLLTPYNESLPLFFLATVNIIEQTNLGTHYSSVASEKSECFDVLFKNFLFSKRG